MRTLLTGSACALVAGVLVATVAFVRGMDRGFARAARADTVMLLNSSAQRDLVRSTMSPGVADLVAADVPGVLRVHGVPAVSPEIHMGTNVRVGDGGEYPAFVRGVSERAYLVHEAVTLLEGSLPASGEVLVGRLAETKARMPEGSLALGRSVGIEGGEFRVAGIFAAPGTVLESEIWAPLFELQGYAQREDVSAVFARMESPEDISEVEVFAQRRLDLELVPIRAEEYYRELSEYFAPIRGLAWVMAVLIAVTVVVTGANTIGTAVQDRMGEIATLQALGYGRGALVRSLLVEALLLAAAGGLVGLALARVFVAGSAFRIGMGAFALEVGGGGVLAGFVGVLLLGLLGTLPAAARMARLSIAAGLRDE